MNEHLEYAYDDPTEEEWLRFAALNFEDWWDPREDIYTLEDGKPFVHEEIASAV